jgi:2-polyprenyl-6-methoxyphenol hydroxylase-like FAD-dependent oxidoreductase
MHAYFYIVTGELICCDKCFSRLGLKSLVLEQSEELKAIGGSIGIWSNGWKALEALGVADGLREKHSKIAKCVNSVSFPGRLADIKAMTIRETYASICNRGMIFAT